MDRDDASVSSSSHAGAASAVTSSSPAAEATSISPVLPLATPVAAAPSTVASTVPTPLSRSVSQQSAASSTRSSRRSMRGGGSRRASSRVPPGSSPQNQPATTTSSASVTSSEDSKSLTSFPSFSPKARKSPSPARFAGPTTSSSTASLVESLLSQPPPPPSSQPLLPVTGPSTSTASTSSVTAASAAAAARSALFEDAPPLPSSHVLPGALHLTDDAHVARLIGKHGAVSLVRQLAEDLAQRDAQVAALRARAADRERALRKIILECGLTSLDLETRLRTLEQEQEARLQSQAAAAAAAAANPAASSSSTHARRVSDLVSDAMSDDNSLRQGSSDYYYNDATIRAAAASKNANNGSNNGNVSGGGTTKGWKDFLWGGGTTKKTGGRANGDGSGVVSSSASSAMRVPAGGDRRPTITDDLFQPPRVADSDGPGRSASRASSVHSANTANTTQSARKASLATLALRLVGGGSGDTSQAPSGTATPSSANAASATAALRTASSSAGGSRKPGPPAATIGRSSRATTIQQGQGGAGGPAGPKSLMSMRRTTSAAVLSHRASPQTIPGGGIKGGRGSGGAAAAANGSGSSGQERWGGEMMEASPANDGLVRRTAYFPVEMDTILPLDVQPPTLTHMYNRYNSDGHLIDRFGFIYDQRRKKRQREAAEVAKVAKVARHVKRGSRHEMLGGRRADPAHADRGGGDDDGVASAAATTADDRSSAGSGDSGSLRDKKNGGDGDETHRSSSPTVSLDDAANRELVADGSKEGIPKRWQDYLKIATFPTELLSHTPAMSDPRIEVITEGGGGGDDAGGPKSPGLLTADGRDDAGPKSPGFLTADGRGFVPPSTGAMAAVTTAATTTTSTSAPTLDTDSIVSGTTEATDDAPQSQRSPQSAQQEDVEPVRLLLQQLSELHDTLQKERTVRWNEFLRKVRAERRREGELADMAAAAGASTLAGTAVMPETRLADGEIIGVAGLGNKGKLGRAKWNEFRALILGGIPVVLRAKVWAECTGATSLRVPGAYDDLVAGRGSGGGDDEEDGAKEDPADVVAQIQADIYRTLTDNIFFREGPGTAKLNEVLLAYARRNPDVGYCQGMNLIAANLLLVTPAAEDAFWLLASIVETILPVGYYDHSLAASRADQQVLRTYVAAVLPRLSAHFDALAIDLETMTFQWFLSVFTDCLSAEALFRVWDVVFCLGDGSVFLFQVALALLKLNEAALLRCATPAAVYTYINHQMTNHAISIDGLIQASEALRKLVRREDVEVRRAGAMDADRALVAARAAAVQEAKAARQRKLAARLAAEEAGQAEQAEQAATPDAVGTADTAS